MTASPTDYQWLASSSGLGESGCLSIFTPATDLDPFLESFGAHSAVEAIDDEASGAQPGSARFAQVVGTAAAVTVAENDGFQGARKEVLEKASRGSRPSKAASIFWNERGMVIASFVRNGKVVASIDLSADPVLEEAKLPATLARSASRWLESGADPVTVGAAMVVQFTGVPISADVLDGDLWRLEPIPDDLDVYKGGNDVPVALRTHPQLVDLIAGAAEVRRRAFARTVAWAAVVQAGLGGEVAVLHAFSPAGDGTALRVSPGVERLQSRLARRRDEIWREDLELETFGSVEGLLVGQQVEALEAVRHLANQDSLSSALGAAAALVNSVALGLGERDLSFVVDHLGRRAVDGTEADRRAELAAAALEAALTADQLAPEFLLPRLPAPLTGAARTAAVESDRARQRRGDYNEYSYRQD